MSPLWWLHGGPGTAGAMSTWMVLAGAFVCGVAQDQGQPEPERPPQGPGEGPAVFSGVSGPSPDLQVGGTGSTSGFARPAMDGWMMDR